MTFTAKITVSNAWNFKILSWSTFNSAFLADVASCVFKSEFFTRLEISDLSNSFTFIFRLSISFINLLKSDLGNFFSQCLLF